jgi:hypothetical protein
MKHSYLLLASGLLLSSSAYAQFGVRAGSNLLAVRTTGATRLTPEREFGYQVGVYYQHPLAKHLYLVPEVQFSRERSQVDYYHTYQSSTDITTRGGYDLSLSYLNVPVLLRVALGAVYLEAGPQVSLLVGGHGQGQLENIYDPHPTPYIWVDGIRFQPIDQAASQHFRRLDAGASVGLGVSLPAGLGLSLRAYRGLMNMEKENPETLGALIPSSQGKMYRQTLQASLTYQLAAR